MTLPGSNSLKLIMRMFLLGLLAFNAYAAEPVLSKDAPPDKPVRATDDDALRMHRAMEPYVQEAKKTYPAAKAKFLKGLPPGEHFFVTTRLRDRKGRIEQVFIGVTSIKKASIEGIIFSEIHLVEGYAMRQPYSFPETELVDWTITKPDGSEEGNVVGKFLDTYTP